MPVSIQVSQVLQASILIQACIEAAGEAGEAMAVIQAGMAGEAMVDMEAGEIGADMEAMAAGASILPVRPGLPAMVHSTKWAEPTIIKAAPVKLRAIITLRLRPTPPHREIITLRTARR